MNNQPLENQEIELGKFFSSIFTSIENFIFRTIRFFLKQKLALSILFILGAVLGFYIDSKTKYRHELVLVPNADVVDYLYAKNDQFNSFKNSKVNKILEEKFKLKKSKVIGEFELEPINDIYGFISANERNFEFLKLLAEDGSIKKIIDETTTSKNYRKHRLTFTSTETISEDEVVKPYLSFLNDDDFLNKVHKQYLLNLDSKVKENDSIISQINKILETYGSKSISSNTVSISGEKIPLDKLIESKNARIYENNQVKIQKLSANVLISDYSVILNIKNNEGFNHKIKYVMPLIFVLLFVFVYRLKNFYIKNKAKLSV